MASRSSVKKVSSLFEADNNRFELEPLEPRLLLSADPLGTQVSADLSTFQSDRDTGGEAYDAERVTAFLSALPQPEQDRGDVGDSLPAALDLDSLDALSAGENVRVLDDFSDISDILLNRDPIDSEPARHEIIFVDSRTPDIESLLVDIQRADTGIRYDIILLDAETDGIDQISDVLNVYQNLDAVHIISHGDTDAVQLGDTWLQSANIEQYASRIAGWQDHLETEADLLFYGCNLAGSETGKVLVEQLSQLSGADVAASDDLTGGTRQGGDWELEYQVGDIETGIVVSDIAQQQWNNILIAYVSQTSSNTSANLDGANSFGQWFARSGGGGTYDIDFVRVELDKDGAASGTITLSVRDGWDGTVLASATKDASTLNDSPTLETFIFAPVSLNDSQSYVVRVDIGPSTGVVNYGYDTTSPYFWGVLVQNGTPDFASDLAFEVGILVGSNSAPVLTANTLDLDQGEVAVIDSTNLAAFDVDSDDGRLVFDISSTTNGYFAYAADTSTAITSFSQDDITSGVVRFVHDGGELSPAFDVSVSDGGIARTPAAATVDFTGTAKGVLWLSLSGNEGTGSGIPGLDTTDIEDDDILQQADQNFSLGETTTNGSFSIAFNASDFAGNEDIKGMHYVTGTTTIGSTNAITLQAGDLILTNRDAATFNSNGAGAPAPLTVSSADIFFFRPDTTGDYSIGNFYMLLSDPFGDGSRVSGITLVEKDVAVGGSNLSAGDLLLSSRDAGREASIWFLETTALDPTVTASYPPAKLLIDGADAGVGFENRIIGLDILEQDTMIGGNSYDAGTLLVSFNADDIDGVGTTAKIVTENEIAALTVTKTSMETPTGNAQLTASIFFDGDNVNFDSNSERIDGFTLTPDIASTNLAPVLDSNNLVVTEGATVTVTNAMLSASDVDSADAGLVFNVSSVNGGQFEITTNTGVAVSSFTQGQILANEVVFVDDGDENPPSFNVNVSDGTNTTANVAGVVTFTNTNNAPSVSVPADVFINELHYDNNGVDVGEAVEVIGPAGTDLTGWSLVFYSGADGLAYHTEALAGIIPDQADNFGTLAFAIAPIQNAATAADGIALVNASADVVQFISYEGTLTAGDGPAAGLTSTDIGVMEDGATLVGDSLQLTGTGSEMTWMAASASTFGAMNTGQNVFAQDTGAEDTDNVYTHGQMLALLGASDTDDADAVLTVNISNVVNGTLTLTGGIGGLGTTFTFTPDLHFNGQLTFDYQVFDDDLAASAIGNGIITIAPVNDNPTGSGLLTTTSVDDNAVAVNLFGALSVADVDVGENDLVLRITLSDATAGAITGGGFIDQGSGVYTASALTVAQANTALDDVQFKAVDNSGSTGSFTTDISVDVDDQGGAGYQPVLSATIVTINRVNDAPSATNLSSTSAYNEGDASVAITDIVVSDVDSGETITATLTLTNTATGSLSANDGATYTAATGVWTITGTVANVNTALVNLAFTPTTNNEIDTTISVVIDDGDEDASGPLTGTITLDVTPINDAPIATNLTSTSSYNEGDASVAITDIVVSDIDAGESITATLTLANTATGSLNANDGATYTAATGVWTITGTVANVNTALSNLTFTPVMNNEVDTTISVVIDDGDEDASGPLTGTITLDVTPINDAPTATNLSSTSAYNEGDASVPISDIVVSDIDAGESITATLTLTNTATGSLSANDGATYTAATGVWTITDTVANVNTALANLTFTPAIDNELDTTISVVIDDGDEDASGPLTGTITLDVTPANDLPTSADSSVVTVENVAKTFAASDFVFSDLETATIDSLRIDSLPGNGVLQNGAVLLNPGDAVLAADLGNLTYTPNTNFNGLDSFTFSVSDGTDYSVNPNTMTITVSAVNSMPASMDTSTSINEDEAKTFTASDFPFADVESASIVALRIDALPTNGVLMNGTTAINAGDVVAATDLANLSFTPTVDFNGTDSFVFSVYDGIDYSATPNTMTIAVNAINDIPTTADFNINTTEDVPRLFSASDFPFADAEITGIVALRIDAVPANGVLMNGTTVLNAGDVVMADDLDQLSYTPNAGFNGSDSFGFSVSDGTAYSSAASIVTASVTPAPFVPPVFVPPADLAVVLPPDVPIIDTLVQPVMAETTAEEADTATGNVTDDEPTSQDEPAQAAEAPAILVPPDGLGTPQAAAAIPDHDSSQRVSVDSSVNVNLQGLLQAIKIQLPGWDNLLLEAGELFDPVNLLESNDFNRDMDQLREEAAEEAGTHKIKAGTGVVLTTGLTVGYVAYLVRGGVLLSSVLSTLPVWNFIDPTPILASMKSGDDDDSNADDSLESLVAQDQQSLEAEDEEVNKEDDV